jgi:tripartite-type tricarboxylate transporter receptor subunit TctC
MRVITVALLLALASLQPNSASRAQDAASYPNKPIRVIVPAGAGAGLDAAARFASGAAENYLGQRLVIENKPGGGQRIGTSLVAKSSPDGYTILFTSPAPITVSEHFRPKIDYDPGRDFAPVAIAVRQPVLLIVRPSLPVRSLQEFIAYADSNRGKIAFGVQGLGTDMHLMMEILKKSANVDLTPVPYNTAAQAIVDLLADRLDAMFFVVAPVKGHIANGRLIALATLSERRLRDLPNLPTVTELNLREMTYVPWFGYLAPSGTPPAIIDKLVDAIRKLPSDPALVKRVTELGADLDIAGPEEFDAIIGNDRRRFAKIAAESRF